MTKKASHRSTRGGGVEERPTRRGGIPIWVSVLVVIFLLIAGGLAAVLLMG